MLFILKEHVENRLELWVLKSRNDDCYTEDLQGRVFREHISSESALNMLLTMARPCLCLDFKLTNQRLVFHS